MGLRATLNFRKFKVALNPMYNLIRLRTFARKFSNIDLFLKILPLKDDELVMSEM